MSRYVCHFSVALSSQHVRLPLRKLLEACRLEPMYETEDYLMAREIPGRVSYAKLVRADVAIHVTHATQDSVKLSFVLKNEELPLNTDNHCRQVFDLLRVTIERHLGWHPIASLEGNPNLLSSHADLHRGAKNETIPTTSDAKLSASLN
jgi:hypothetical protein